MEKIKPLTGELTPLAFWENVGISLLESLKYICICIYVYIGQFIMHCNDSDSYLVEPTMTSSQIPIEIMSGDQMAQQGMLVSQISFSNYKKDKSGVVMTIANITNSILKFQAILGLPYIFKLFGYAPALFFLFIFYVLTVISCKILLRDKNQSGHSNISSIGRMVFGSKWLVMIIFIAIIINSLGLCIIQLTICGKNTYTLFQQKYNLDKWYNSRQFFTMCYGFLLFPFLFIRNIQKFKIISLASIITMLILSGVVVYNFVQIFRSNQIAPGFKPFAQEFEFYKAFSSLPTILLIFLFQMNFFPIFKVIKQGSDSRMFNASWISLTGCFIFCCLFGMAGYAIYGNEITHTNFLIIISQQQIGVTLYYIVYISFIICGFSTFPFMFYSARNSFISLVKCIFPTNIVFSSHVEGRKQMREKVSLLEKCRFFGQTIVLYCGVLGLAMFVGDLGPYYNLVGVLGSNSLGFVFPCLYCIILTNRKSRWKKDWIYYSSIIILIISILMGIVCIGCLIKVLIQQNQ